MTAVEINNHNRIIKILENQNRIIEHLYILEKKINNIHEKISVEDSKVKIKTKHKKDILFNK